MTAEPVATLVGWCRDCEAYTVPPEGSCPGDEGDPDDPHEYEELELYLCRLPNHCDAEGFLTVEALLEHEAPE